MLIAVFASALSPMIIGIMIDQDFSLAAILGLNIFLVISAQLISMLTLYIRQ